MASSDVRGWSKSHVMELRSFVFCTLLWLSTRIGWPCISQKIGMKSNPCRKHSFPLLRLTIIQGPFGYNCCIFLEAQLLRLLEDLELPLCMTFALLPTYLCTFLSRQNSHSSPPELGTNRRPAKSTSARSTNNSFQVSYSRRCCVGLEKPSV